MKEKVVNNGVVEEEKKTTAKKATAKAATGEKKVAEKKVTEKKTTEKKAAEKKTVAKTGKKDIFVQFGDREISTEDIQKKIESAYTAEGHKMKASDEVRAYVKPEENMIYYVVNDSYASGINLFD